MKIQRTFEISPNAQTETAEQHVPQFTDLSNHDSAAESKPNGVISTLEKPYDEMKNNTQNFMKISLLHYDLIPIK